MQSVLLLKFVESYKLCYKMFRPMKWEPIIYPLTGLPINATLQSYVSLNLYWNCLLSIANNLQ